MAIDDYAETLSELANYPKALSHAGTGGGGALKTITVKNSFGEEIVLNNIVYEGQYYDTNGAGVTLADGEEKTFQYVEPAAGNYWATTVPNGTIAAEEVPGVIVEDGDFGISAEAADGAYVEFVPDPLG